MPEDGRPVNYRWRILSLLFFATMINYIDRQIIGILKPYIAEDLGWGEADYGYIITASQVAYAIGLVTIGRFLDKYGTRVGYLWAIIVWSFICHIRRVNSGKHRKLFPDISYRIIFLHVELVDFKIFDQGCKTNQL